MVPFRSMGDDCPDRLRRFLFPLELEAMTPELVYWGALYGIAEMFLSGTTTFLDMYYFEDRVAEACEQAGIRGYLGETLIGQKTCDSPDEEYGGFAQPLAAAPPSSLCGSASPSAAIFSPSMRSQPSRSTRSASSIVRMVTCLISVFIC